MLSGEAGIGKTSLLRALATGAQSSSPVWWGACDALQTPHPLAPLLDMARNAPGTGFATRLDGPRGALFEAVLAELQATQRPVLMVVEDAHWADDATLDLLKFIGRRIQSTHALLAVSYRDDEVGSVHPLHRLLGELPSEAVTRLKLPRLSAAAVAALAQQALRAPVGLFEATQGNPFFVTELLRGGIGDDNGVPSSVQALVLARFARLPPGAQAVVRVASLVPTRIEHELLAAVLPEAAADVQAAIDSGLLQADLAALQFRHELARVAIASSGHPWSRAACTPRFCASWSAAKRPCPLRAWSTMPRLQATHRRCAAMPRPPRPKPASGALTAKPCVTTKRCCNCPGETTQQPCKNAQSGSRSTRRVAKPSTGRRTPCRLG